MMAKIMNTGIFNAGAVLMFILLVGCHSAPRSSPDAPKTSVLPDSRVILDAPIVTFDKNRSIIIDGTLHRNPYVGGLLTGRIDVQFISSDDEILDQLPILIVPKNIPTDPNVSATYHTMYGYIPPKGSKLLVHFVDAETMAREDIEGGEYDTGAAGPARAGVPAHAGHAAGFGSGGYGGNFGGNFGNNNFGPNGGHH